MTSYSRKGRQIGDPTGDACYHCQGPRIWIHAVDGRKLADGSPGWMRGCPNYGKTCRPRRRYSSPRPQQPAPAPKPQAVIPFTDEQLAKLVDASVASAISKLDLNQPMVHTWTTNGVKVAELKDKRPHAALSEVMRRIQAGLQNVLLVGPAGTGKTTLAAHLAESLGREVYCQSVSGGTDETTLIGRGIPNITGGPGTFEGTEFIRLFESGGVILLDEFDGIDPNVGIIINAALANGYLSLPARLDNPKALRHPDCVILAAANTYGYGGNAMYQGRNALDGATLDRFIGAVIEVDYDRKLEETLVPDPDITLRIWAMREKVEQYGLNRLVGTRALLAVAKLHQSGLSLRESIQALLVGWTDDEKRKIGEVWR